LVTVKILFATKIILKTTKHELEVPWAPLSFYSAEEEEEKKESISLYKVAFNIKRIMLLSF
jgi:hypothetical protein